jgi:ribosome-associated protein
LKIVIPDSELEFSYARSSGPGGQNVNKTSSKAILHWNLENAPWVPAAVKSRFVDRFHNRMTVNGDVVIHSDESRDRSVNERRCLEKLEEMLEQVWRAPTKRIATKPSASSRKRRLAGKRQRSDIKKGRRKVSDD